MPTQTLFLVQASLNAPLLDDDDDDEGDAELITTTGGGFVLENLLEFSFGLGKFKAFEIYEDQVLFVNQG
jgi:hypothetical protein